MNNRSGRQSLSTSVNFTKIDSHKHKLEQLYVKYERKVPINEMYGPTQFSNCADLQREVAASENLLVYRETEKRYEATLEDVKRQRSTEVEKRRSEMEKEMHARIASLAELEKQILKRRLALDEASLSIQTRSAESAALTAEISRIDDSIAVTIQNIARLQHAGECRLQLLALRNKLYDLLFPIRFALIGCHVDTEEVAAGTETDAANLPRSTRCNDPACRERCVGVAKLTKSDGSPHLRAFDVNLHDQSTTYLRTLVWSFMDPEAQSKDANTR